MMRSVSGHLMAAMLCLGGASLALTSVAFAEDAKAATKQSATAAGGKQAAANDADDPSRQQAARLLAAIDGILNDAAQERADARKLPSKDEFLITPLWTETKEDREDRIRELLDSALGVVTDVPIVDLQKKVDERRKSIREIDDQIAQLRQKQLTAPKDSLLPGILTDTVDSIESKVADLGKRIEDNREEIAKTKVEIHGALAASGIEMSPDQLDLILDSVLSGDLVKLVATFNAAKLIDEQLSKMVGATGDNLAAARKFFAMHSALFAMLVHAQDSLIKKIDSQYMPRLAEIDSDIGKTRKETQRLLKEQNRSDQKKALESNLKSQDFAARVANYYRSYLLQQREQLAQARMKAVRDLRIADNTYETVEASFQLRALIKDATSSFEAIQKLDAPGFDKIFENEDLRREFENLTRKLDVPTS